MKTLLIIICLVIFVGGFAIDFIVAGTNEFTLIHTETICQYETFAGQWDIVDSNMGIVSYSFVGLPVGATGEPNGLVTYTPQEAGTFYIKVVAICELNDPNACLWPEERREKVKIIVNPTQTWSLQFRPVAQQE